MAEKSSLTKKKKTGYAFGIFTESLIYNMFYTYYLTFLIEIGRHKACIQFYHHIHFYRVGCRYRPDDRKLYGPPGSG